MSRCSYKKRIVPFLLRGVGGGLYIVNKFIDEEYSNKCTTRSCPKCRASSVGHTIRVYRTRLTSRRNSYEVPIRWRKYGKKCTWAFEKNRRKDNIGKGKLFELIFVYNSRNEISMYPVGRFLSGARGHKRNYRNTRVRHVSEGKDAVGMYAMRFSNGLTNTIACASPAIYYVIIIVVVA